MGKMIIKNHCPFPNRAKHDPVQTDEAVRFNRKPLHVVIHGEGQTWFEGDAKVCRNCGALYVEAEG